MTRRHSDVSVEVSPDFWAAAALLLFLEVPARVLGAFLIAALVHEMGHCLAARIQSFPIQSLRLSAAGAQLQILRPSRCGYRQEALLLFAGPMANLLCVGPSLCLGQEALAGAHLLLAGFNLLPILPLDGGGLACVLEGRFLPPAWGNRCSCLLGDVFCALLFLPGIRLAGNGNPTLFFLALWLLLCHRA